MNPVILSIARHALTVLGTWAVAKGFIPDAGTAEQVVGALVTIIGVVWGAMNAKKES